MKKILSIVIAAANLFNVITLAKAEGSYTEGDWVYSSENGNIIAWAGTDEDVVIPPNSVVDSSFGFKNKGLMSEQKREYVNVKSLTVSENVKIEGDIGLVISNLETITFYNDAEDMQEVSLYFAGNTKLRSLHLPENLKQIEDGMCSNCSKLEELYIPDSVRTIGKSAFENCINLTAVTLPTSLETIKPKAFDGCGNIQSIRNMPVNGYENVYVTRKLNNITFIGNPNKTRDFYRHFFNTDWMQKSVLPNINGAFLVADGYLIKYLGSNKDVTIPNGVKIIDEDAFYKSDIEKLTIPNQVIRINRAAFKLCKNLKEVTLPESLEYVEMGAFSECISLSKLTINGKTAFEDNVFEECSSLTDSGITVNGEIVPVMDYDIESNPFAFTNTSYNKDGNIIPATVSPVPVDTQKEDTAATHQPQSTETPKMTEKPTASSVPESEKEKTLTVTKDENGKITIGSDGNLIAFNGAQPFIDENDRTQIPIRAVAEALDCTVSWDEASQTAAIIKGNEVITVTIGSKAIKANGKTITMDTTALLVNYRTYIPIHFVGEALGITIDFENDTDV